MCNAVVSKVRERSISYGVANALSSVGYKTRSFPEDVDVRGAEGLFEGNESVFVNCVGVTDNAKPDEWDYERAHKTISVNLTSAISMTSEFVRKTRGNGKHKTIFHIGSLWSRKHATNGAVYCASKAGLAHYVSCVAHDLEIHYPGEYTVIGVHPGNVIGTPLTEEVQYALLNNRGFTPGEVENLYDGCITTKELGELVVKMVGNKWFSGENVYLGNNDKR